MRSGLRVAAAILLVWSAVSCTSPTDPESRFVDLQVAYTFIAPQGDRDLIDAASCSHHYAPGNLQIQTSWGESTRFQEGTGGAMVAGLRARRGGQYWLSFFDIRYCGYGSGIVPPGGVSVNGVMLTMRDQVDRLDVFRFTVDADGTVRP